MSRIWRDPSGYWGLIGFTSALRDRAILHVPSTRPIDTFLPTPGSATWASGRLVARQHGGGEVGAVRVNLDCWRCDLSIEVCPATAVGGLIARGSHRVFDASKLLTVRVQASAYTPELKFNSAKALAHLLAAHADRFDGESVSLPSADGKAGSPPPMVVIKSQDNKLTVWCRPERIDVIAESPAIDQPVDLGGLLAFAPSVIEGYGQATGARLGRLACVLTRVVLTAEPAKVLASHFCAPAILRGPLNRPADFELHSRKVFPLGGWVDVNSWVRFKTGLSRPRDGVPAEPLVLVEQDINTVIDEADNRSFSVEEIGRFFGDCSSEFSHVLGLYLSPVEASQ